MKSAIICPQPSGGGVNFLALTFDAAGNAPPMLGLAEALIARGHAVAIIGHDNQAARIESRRLPAFLPFPTGFQRDGVAAEPLTMAWAESFDHAAAWDLLSAARCQGSCRCWWSIPQAAGSCLEAALTSHWRTIDLCHTPYEIMAISFYDGRFPATGLEGADLDSYQQLRRLPCRPAGPGQRRLRRAAQAHLENLPSWARRHLDKPLVLSPAYPRASRTSGRCWNETARRSPRSTPRSW